MHPEVWYMCPKATLCDPGGCSHQHITSGQINYICSWINNEDLCVMCISDNVLDHAIIVAIQLMPLYEMII